MPTRTNVTPILVITTLLLTGMLAILVTIAPNPWLLPSVLLASAAVLAMFFRSDFGLFVLLTVSAFSMVFQVLGVQDVFSFSGSSLRIYDMVLALFLLSWLLRRNLGQQPSWDVAGKLLIVVLAILVVPGLLGWVWRNNWVTIARDVRVPIYYVVALAVYEIFPTRQALQRLVVFLHALAIISVVFFWLSWSLNHPTPFAAGAAEVEVGTLTVSRSYGVITTWPYIAWSFFVVVASLIIPDRLSVSHFGIKFAYAGAMIGQQLLSLVRAQYVGLVTGGAAMLVILVPRRYIRWKTVLAVICIAIVVIPLTFWTPFASQVSIVQQRVVAIFALNPLDSGYAAWANLNARLQGLRIGLERGKEHWGMGTGYGEAFADPLWRDDVVGILLFHTSYGWSFFKLGYWLTAMYFLVVGYLALLGWRATVAPGLSVDVRASLTGFIAFLGYELSRGLGASSFFDFFGPGMLPFIVTLGILARASSGAYVAEDA